MQFVKMSKELHSEVVTGLIESAIEAEEEIGIDELEIFVEKEKENGTEKN